MTTVRRGFRYDRGTSKLEVVVDGKVVAKFNDISPSLSLTDPLPVGSGGTGVATLTNHYVLVGSDTDAITPVTPGTADLVLTSNGTSSDPSFKAITGGVSRGFALFAA